MTVTSQNKKTMFPLFLVATILLLLSGSGSANYHKEAVNRFFGGARTPPVFVHSGGKTIKVTVGDTVTIPCQILNRGDATVVWKQGERVIYADTLHIGIELRASIVDDTSLLLRGVDTQYTGNYTCEVEWSPEQPPVSLSHYLEVCVPPTVVAINTEGGAFVDVREGENVTLECEADGIPRPTISWISSRWGSNRNEQGSKLNLTNTQRTDSGQYSCIATNHVGQPASAQITLRVQYAPVVSAVPPKISTVEGHRVSLTCSVLSVPKSDIRWYFERRQLKMDDKHMMEERGNNYTLTVANVREKDMGEYVCSAVNKIGEGQAFVLLTGIPYDLDITSASQGIYKHTYNLTWSLKTFVALDETEISYRRTGLGSWITRSINHRIPWTNENYYYSNSRLSTATHDEDDFFHSNTKPISQGTYTFVDLAPNTEYEVKIRAKNKFGWSENEPAFVFKTSRRDPEPQKMSTLSDGSSEWRSHATSIRYLCLSFILTTFVTMVVVASD